MKQVYFILLLLCSIVLSAQETENIDVVLDSVIPEFKLYPNPAPDDVVFIMTKDNLYKEIVVYDVFGKIVLTDRITNNYLNISQLVPGVYVLQVTENKKTMTRKLVIV